VSSTTERRREGGQVLVLFALSAFVIILVAALAFDVGAMLVEQRDQQNTADAAALAGARYLPGDTNKANARAQAVATANGFQNGTNNTTVTTTFGSWSPGGGFSPGTGTSAIRVEISHPTGAIFGGIVGRSQWQVSTGAVAVNESSTSGPFALLALSPTACPGVRVEGSGVVSTAGNVQINSTCNTGDRAFRVAGTGSLDLIGTGIGCNVSAVSPGWTQGGGVSLNECNPPNVGAPAIPDPYSLLAAPPTPSLPTAMRRWDVGLNQPHATNTPPPAGCPGSATPATDASPAKCTFGGSFSGMTFRMYPGYYPGGLDLGGADFLLEPGLYYVGDGGFRAANVKITSVDPGGVTLGGGVLIYNGTHTSTAVNPGQVILQGGSAEVNLWPLEGAGALADYDNMVIYQDRTISLAVQIEGGGSSSSVRGIIYAPAAHVAARGNAGTLTLDQVIAWTFEARGNGGTINVAYGANFLPNLQYAGLVE
jgi:Flp pilus assembly protein TadG